MKQLQRIWQFFSNFLFSRANKEFLFSCSSSPCRARFWLSLTLNETYEQEFAIPFSVTDIPKNAVLTSDDVDTVRMTIRDKGIVLLAYNYGDYLKHVKIPFRSYTRNNGTGYVSAQELQKLVYQRMLSSSKITSVKQDKLEFYYNYGTKKQVPVRWSGRVIPDELFFISRVHYSPDSVTVYAADDKLDSISIIYTEPLNYANFRDTLRIDCHLTRMKGVKIVPDHVRVTLLH